MMIRRTLLGLFLFVLAALPSAAQFNGCVAGFCSSSSQWVFPGATLDLDFANNRYFGVANGIDSLTTTRASTGYAQALNGTWINFGNNIARRTDRGLLVEESRTNSIRNNSMQGVVAGSPGTLPTNWARSGAGLTMSVVGSGTQNGVDYVDLRWQGTTGSTFGFVSFDATNGIAASNGQTWAQSNFVSLVGGSFTNVTAVFLNPQSYQGAGVFLANNGGPNIVSSITPIPARFLHSAALSGGAGITFVFPTLYFSWSSGVAVDFTLRIGWPQLELGAFATSPIRTTNAAATRATDVITLATGSWYNASAGTLYVEGSPSYSAVGSGVPGLVQIDDGTSGNRITLRRVDSSALGSFIVVTGTVAQASITGQSWSGSAVHKLAGAFADNDFMLADNGSLGLADTSGTVPTVTTLRPGSGPGVSYLNGYIRRLSYFNSRLPNATLQSITQ